MIFLIGDAAINLVSGLAYALPTVLNVMNISDFIVIYLACGAPFAVYFFLQNRKKFAADILWLKSLLTVFVWIPYAFRLLHDFTTTKSRLRQLKTTASLDEKLRRMEKSFLEFRAESPGAISAFELREVLERYRGLTLAERSGESSPGAAEREFFRVSLRSNHELGAKCLRRRAARRLAAHQAAARRDFLRTIADLFVSVRDPEDFINLTLRFVETLDDSEARQSLPEIFDKTKQTERDLTVRDLEKKVWKPREIKQSSINRKPVHTQTWTTATIEKD